VHTSLRDSRQAALVELERLHAAILASRAKRGLDPVRALSPEAVATRDLTQRLQGDELGRVGQVDESGGRRLWWLAAAAAVVLAGAWVAMTHWPRSEVVTEAAPPAAAPSPAAASTAAAPAPEAAAPVASPRAVHLVLETIRPVWMRVVVDGRRAIEREVAAGEHLAFEGDGAIVVRVGDAGGVRARFNGDDRGALGRDGLPLTVSFPTAAAPAPAPTVAPAEPAEPAPAATTPAPATPVATSPPPA
jgi:hypothetical protein